MLTMKLSELEKTVKLRDLNSEMLYELQTILSELGYQLSRDGLYGSQTQKAFNQFKLDQKLTHPDYIGKTTVDKLLDVYKENDFIEDEAKTSQQPVFNTPSTIKLVDWNNFNSSVSRWFTVGEVYRFDPQRKTTDSTIRNRIIILAKELDKIRDEWGSGIGVTSWYRPPSVNRRVGGVSNSRHLFGDAVDIYPINGQLIGFQSWLDKQWYGALGYGARKGFTHLDMRNGKGWKTGGSKGVRWNY